MRQPHVHILVLVASVAITGCAARNRPLSPSVPPALGAEKSDAPEDSLQAHMEKVRQLSAAARPAGATAVAVTLDSRDVELAAALLELKASPTAESHLAVGELYRRRGVLDAAYRHYNAAVKLEPHNAAAYEGLARTWRDWKLPALAAGDAARARYYAPASPSIQNTFGTIMQALGRRDDARFAYEQARRLDSGATYALNNLCYLSFVEGRMQIAVEQCSAAIAMDPALKSAHYNLALAYAASGEMGLARAAFAEAGDPAETSFNLGILHMARRDYISAAAAFDAASRARPALNIARERAQQARALLRTAAQAPVSGPTDQGDMK